MSKPFLKVTSDFTKSFNDTISVLKDKETLVGIPQSEAPRKEGDPINNAALLFINEYGSPAQNIPARQPMKTGIRNAQESIAEQFKNCAKNVLSKGASVIDVYFERAGIIASNSVKKAINDQENMAAPAPATIAARKRSGFNGTSALIVTGQLRNAITYVVRSKRWL